MPAFLFSPLLRYGLLALVIVGVLTTIYVQHLKLQTCAAEKKYYEEWIASAKKSIDDAKKINETNLLEIDRIQQDSNAAVAAITADRDRIASQQVPVRIIREKINVDAKTCVGGVPPAIRSVVDWVREHPDPSNGFVSSQGSQGGDSERSASMPPRTSTRR